MPPTGLTARNVVHANDVITSKSFDYTDYDNVGLDASACGLNDVKTWKLTGPAPSSTEATYPDATLLPWLSISDRSFTVNIADR